jgi:peptidoglycan glycosyltransferase
MNRQISRISLAGVALIAALVVATTYWQTWAAAGLADRQDNAIQRVAEFKIRRGDILTERPRVLLAASRARTVKGDKLFFRRYPAGGLAAQTVGYSTQGRSRTGLEQSLNDYLVGANQNLSTVLRRTADQLRGKTITGNDVVLTLRPGAQRLSLNLLGRTCGAVVALDPRNGRVLVNASTPTYNPNLVEHDFRAIQRVRADCTPPAPLLNRGTQGLYAPGSTFKVVTATAALDSGKVRPDTVFSDPGYCIEYGQRVSNAGNPDTGPEAFGSISFFNGLVHSVNSVFCNTGKLIGAGRILDYAKKFGFYRDPPLETPSNERVPSGLYKGARLFDPKDPATQVDPGRLAFGQERLLVTPLQMAMVAAAVANRGELMRPHVVDRILAPNGDVVTRTKPKQYSRPMKASTAAMLTPMMEGVVTSGTGTNAQIPGIRVAGKTGTAETGRPGIYTSWFIAFAPADHPRVAIAVVLQNQTQAGGIVAAPIAKSVMQALLSVPSNS